MTEQKNEIITTIIPLQEKTTDGIIILNKEDFAPFSEPVYRVLRVDSSVEMINVLTDVGMSIFNIPESILIPGMFIFQNKNKQLISVYVKRFVFNTDTGSTRLVCKAEVKLSEDVFADISVYPTLTRGGGFVTIDSETTIIIDSVRLLINGELITYFPADGADIEDVKAEVSTLHLFGYVPAVSYLAVMTPFLQENTLGKINQEVIETESQQSSLLSIGEVIMEDQSQEQHVVDTTTNVEEQPTQQLIEVNELKEVAKEVDTKEQNFIARVTSTTQGPRLIRILNAYIEEMSGPNSGSNSLISRHQNNLLNVLKAVLETTDDFQILWNYILFCVTNNRNTCFSHEMMFRGLSVDWKGSEKNQNQLVSLLNIIDLTAEVNGREINKKKFKISNLTKYDFSEQAIHNLTAFYD